MDKSRNNSTRASIRSKTRNVPCLWACWRPEGVGRPLRANVALDRCWRRNPSMRWGTDLGCTGDWRCLRIARGWGRLAGAVGHRCCSAEHTGWYWTVLLQQDLVLVVYEVATGSVGAETDLEQRKSTLALEKMNNEGATSLPIRYQSSQYLLIVYSSYIFSHQPMWYKSNISEMSKE